MSSRDFSNGYEFVAAKFIKHREDDVKMIGAAAVRDWAKSLAPHSAVLDMGCGSGIPITKVLIEEEMKAYGIDASATMIMRFKENFPEIPFAFEPVEDSNFFNRRFEGVVAWGLMFLLSKESQERLIKRVAAALKPGGKLLFTAPYQKTHWEDVMTGRTSRSLGREKYRKLLSASGFSLLREFEDEAGNYYFSSIKT